MDFGIAGKRALVVGGSMGIGFAVCRALAAEGVNLVIFARNKERSQDAANRLKQTCLVDVDVVVGDSSVHDDVRQLRQATEQLGGVDILILNVTRPPSPMRDFLAENEPQRWEDGYRTQLHGGILVLQEITPQIVKKGWGRIVGITSASVKHPMPRHAISTIYRAGLAAALKHLANEIARSGVTVNVVAPASIRSDSFADVHDLEERIKRVPLGRLGTVDEFAGAVVFFASQQAGFITGQNLQVDGGMTSALL